VGKLILISIILATIAIPAAAAYMRRPDRGLFVTVAGTLAAVVGYFLAVFFVYPHLM